VKIDRQLSANIERQTLRCVYDVRILNIKLLFFI